MPAPLTQLLSRTVYATDGVTTTWDFSFSGGYLDKAHVKAHIELPTGERTDLTITAPLFTGPYQLFLSPALAAGSTLTIYRDTPKNLPLVDFADEGGLSEIALDTMAKQAIFVAAETTDTVNTSSSYDAEQSADQAATAAAAAVISANAAGASAVTAGDHATSAGLSAVAAAASASLSAVTSINGGQLAGLRNRIINGNFGVNQRMYASGAAVGANLYGHDRWKMAASADTYTFSTTANVTTVTIPAGKVLRQVIEGLNLESGTFVLSWVGTAQGKIGAGAYGASGVTGSITGGTDTTIEFGPGTVSKVQFEFGSVATVFEQRPYGMELALCKRYLPSFTATGGDDIAWGTTINASAGTVSFLPDVEPRVPPTSFLSSGAFSCSTGTVLASVAALAFSTSGKRRFRLSVTAVGTPFSANLPLALFDSGSAKILFNGCEL